MTGGTVTERSLYPHLSSYLEKLDFTIVSEYRGNSGQLDILAEKENVKFVIEVKIGQDHNKKILEGFSQAIGYAKDNNTYNIIVMDYPPEIRSTLTGDLKYSTLCAPIHSVIATEYLNTSCYNYSARDVFDTLNNNFENRKSDEVDLNLIINVIDESISKVSNTLRSLSKRDMDSLIELIIGKFDLFLALSELRNNNEINNVALNLISYLIVNQMLFYHMFAEKSKLILPLEELGSISDLSRQFKNITDMDYKAIYQINIVDRLPENVDIVRAFNDIIDVFKIFKPESIEHDLMGRLFHDLLPYETRKILAAFYTNPIAGQILAGLCINKEDDKVIDPACGSGTLLVSAYNRKRDLNTREAFHKFFIEEELTGFDIMPFATHLTAVNLSSQSIETTTDKLNVGVEDSLSLSNKLKNKKVFTVEGFSRELQTTLNLFGSEKSRLISYTSSSSTGAVSADGENSNFKVRKNSFDVCIANPPFSDREKLPNNYLDVLKNYEELTKVCGSQVNLWGYFIALADILLKPNGILGFVIPINIFRGVATQKIRDFLLNNYTIQYVVKTGKNIAFSENSNFRDVLIIAKKRKPNKRCCLNFAIINEDLHDLDFNDANNISKYIKEELFTAGKDVKIVSYNQFDLIENSQNLMPYFGFKNSDNSHILTNFNNLVKEKFEDKLRKLSSDEISEGFHASPAGVSQMTFITNNYESNRLSRAFLIYKTQDEDNIYATIKNFDSVIKIPKKVIKPAFRTLSSVNTFCIDNKLDFFIMDTFDGYEHVLNLSKFNQKKNIFSYEQITRHIDKFWTHMVVGRRFAPNSPNTSFFAFSSSEKFISPHTFKSIHLDELNSKINTLYLNSVIGILNLILLREQTTGDFTDIMQSDLLLLDILNIDKLSENDVAKLLDLYEEFSGYEFPSIVEQFDKEFVGRVKLDTKLLMILGFTRQEIADLLPGVYKAIVLELS